MRNSDTPADIHAGRLIDSVQDDEIEGVHREMDRMWAEMQTVKREIRQLQERSRPGESDVEGSLAVLTSLLSMAVSARHIEERERSYSGVSSLEDVIATSRSKSGRSQEEQDAQISIHTVKHLDDLQRDEWRQKDRVAGEYVPATFVRFHSLAIAVMTVAATLLVLTLGFDVQTIHPAISGLGLAGGFSWFVTALLDMKEWRRQQVGGEAG